MGQLPGPVNETLGTYGGREYQDEEGGAFVWAKAHANLTANTPYQEMFDGTGPVTKAITDEVVRHRIIVPLEAVTSGDFAWMKFRGVVEDMVVSSDAYTDGHAIIKTDATLVCTDAAPSGADGEFAVALETSDGAVTAIDAYLFGRESVGS